MTTAQQRRLEALERATGGGGEHHELLWKPAAGLASVQQQAAELSANGHLVVTVPKRAEGVAA